MTIACTANARPQQFQVLRFIQFESLIIESKRQNNSKLKNRSANHRKLQRRNCKGIATVGDIFFLILISLAYTCVSRLYAITWEATFPSYQFYFLGEVHVKFMQYHDCSPSMLIEISNNSATILMLHDTLNHSSN